LLKRDKGRQGKAIQDKGRQGKAIQGTGKGRAGKERKGK